MDVVLKPLIASRARFAGIRLAAWVALAVAVSPAAARATPIRTIEPTLVGTATFSGRADADTVFARCS